MELTNKQQEVIKTFWKSGYFRVEDLKVVYTTNNSIADCLNKLLCLKIIKQEFGSNKFIIDREKFLELQ